MLLSITSVPTAEPVDQTQEKKIFKAVMEGSAERVAGFVLSGGFLTLGLLPGKAHLSSPKWECGQKRAFSSNTNDSTQVLPGAMAK